MRAVLPNQYYRTEVPLGEPGKPLDIGAWLRDLGLEQYDAAFRDNDVDAEVLPKLTAEDLISIGVASVGHRRKLLAAIASLRVETPIAPVGGSPLPNPPPLAGEGRVGWRPSAGS